MPESIPFINQLVALTKSSVRCFDRLWLEFQDPAIVSHYLNEANELAFASA